MTRLDPLRIGFVSEVSLTSRAAWSGTLGYMLKALTEAGGHVDEIRPILEGPTYVLNKVSRVVERVTGHNPMLNRTVTVAKQKARRLQQEARAQSVDLLFAPVGSSLIAQMPEGMPIAYCSDATVKLMSTYGDYVATANAATSTFRGPSDFSFRSAEWRFQ